MPEEVFQEVHNGTSHTIHIQARIPICLILHRLPHFAITLRFVLRGTWPTHHGIHTCEAAWKQRRNTKNQKKELDLVQARISRGRRAAAMDLAILHQKFPQGLEKVRCNLNNGHHILRSWYRDDIVLRDAQWGARGPMDNKLHHTPCIYSRHSHSLHAAVRCQYFTPRLFSRNPSRPCTSTIKKISMRYHSIARL